MMRKDNLFFSVVLSVVTLFISLSVGCAKLDPRSPEQPGSGPITHEEEKDKKEEKTASKFGLQSQTELEGSFSICTIAPVGLIKEPKLDSILSNSSIYFPNGVFARLDATFSGSNLTVKLTIHKNSTCTDAVLEFLGEGRFATGLPSSSSLKMLDTKIERVFGTTWNNSLAQVLNYNEVCDLKSWRSARRMQLTGLPCEGQLLDGFLKLGFSSYKLEDNTRLFLGRTDLSHNPLSDQSRPTELLTLPLIRVSSPSVIAIGGSSELEVSDVEIWVAEDNSASEKLPITYKLGGVPSFSVNAFPSHGFLELLANGSFKYTPFHNYIGLDSFEFKVVMGNEVKEARANIKIDKVTNEPRDLRRWLANLEMWVVGALTPPSVVATVTPTPTAEPFSAYVGFGGALGVPQSTAVTADNKFYYVGGTGGPNSVPKIARFNADLSPDTSFGTGGVSTVNIGTNSYFSGAVVQYFDGKIVATGYSYNRESIIVRFNHNGTVDDGFKPINMITNGTGFSTPVIQGDRKILAASGDHIYRFNTNGTLDYSFGGGSGAVLGFANFALQSDQKIVAIQRQQPAVIVRYFNDGGLDYTFTRISLDFNYSASALSIQADGKIIFGGDVSIPGHYFVSRVTQYGNIDYGFAHYGIYSGFFAGSGASWGQIGSLIALPNGNIFGVGISGSFELTNLGAVESDYVDKIGYLACSVPSANQAPNGFVYVTLACGGGGTIYKVKTSPTELPPLF